MFRKKGDVICFVLLLSVTVFGGCSGGANTPVYEFTDPAPEMEPMETMMPVVMEPEAFSDYAEPETEFIVPGQEGSEAVPNFNQIPADMEPVEPEQDNSWNRMQESTGNALPAETQPPVTVPVETEPMETEPEETEAAETEPTETEPVIVLEETLPFGMLENPDLTDFVNVAWYIPDIVVELRYAGSDNFTSVPIYGFQDAYLRYGTVMKLNKVCEELKEHGVYLKIWDAFRPASAQFKLWSIYPDPNYVADPNRGFSAHTRGNTLDVTLVDSQGKELPMPSGFDDFSDAANRDYVKCSEEARQNALLLESVMENNGFQGYWGEWWHFTDTYSYEVEKVFDPAEISIWYPKCNEFITLRKKASAYSEAVDEIRVGYSFTVLGYTDQFAMVEFNGQRGYVLRKYMQQTP